MNEWINARITIDFWNRTTSDMLNTLLWLPRSIFRTNKRLLHWIENALWFLWRFLPYTFLVFFLRLLFLLIIQKQLFRLKPTLRTSMLLVLWRLRLDIQFWSESFTRFCSLFFFFPFFFLIIFLFLGLFFFNTLLSSWAEFRLRILDRNVEKLRRVVCRLFGISLSIGPYNRIGRQLSRILIYLLGYLMYISFG